MLLRLAWRNLWRNPRRTAIVVTAVAVGLAGCLVSMALNFGMVAQMVETAIGTELGHLQIHAPGWERGPKLELRLRDGARQSLAVLERTNLAKAFTTRVRGDGLVNSPRASVGVRIIGVDPTHEPKVSRLSRSLVAGTWFDRRRRVVLGAALARRLHVRIGDKIAISVQDLSGDLTGGGYRVGGLFRTASSAFDRGTLLIRSDQAQALFGLGDAVSEVVVIARRRADIEALRATLAAALGARAEVRSWAQLQPLLAYMVEVFDTTAWYLYAAVFTAMAFGIANVLLMAVYERAREIGMLMAMGMRRQRVVASVVLEAMLVTLLGLALGIAIAVAAVWMMRDGIDLSAFSEGLSAWGIGTRLIPVLRASDFAIPVVVASVAALLASAWPALRAVRARPAEALRRI